MSFLLLQIFSLLAYLGESVSKSLCAFWASPLFLVNRAASRGRGSAVTVDWLRGRRARASESYREEGGGGDEKGMEKHDTEEVYR